MAKSNKSTAAATDTVKAKRPKSAAALAKKAANIAAYQRRCEALRAKQATLNGVRKVVGKTLSDDACIVVLDRLDRAKETENARQAIIAHMASPVYGERLAKFLGNRPGVDPCRLLVVVNNWLRVKGLRPAA